MKINVQWENQVKWSYTWSKVIKKIKPNHKKTFKQDMQGCCKKWRQLDKKTLATWHYECDEQRSQWEQKHCQC